jgi:hypothetical protein
MRPGDSSFDADLMNRRTGQRGVQLWIRLAVVATIGVLGIAEPAVARPSICERARTIIADERVKVVRLDGHSYACPLGSHRAISLGDTPAFPDQIRITQLRVAGRYVGYAFSIRGREEPAFEVRVLDVRARRLVRRLDAVVPGFDPAVGVVPAVAGGVTDLELKPNGSVAWIARNPFVPGGRVEVHRADTTGAATLAAGADIAPASLAITETLMYWLTATGPVVAPLR